MRQITLLAILALLLAAATPCFGQPNACGPVGTWYGGSDMTHPYQMTITPIDPNSYSVRGQEIYDYASIGILGTTDWTGVLTRGPDRKYSMQMVAFFWNSDSSINPEMDAVHCTVEFTDDGNTIRNTITTYIAYLPWTENKVPFVTPPDLDILATYLEGQPIVETYHRMPAGCKREQP